MTKHKRSPAQIAADAKRTGRRPKAPGEKQSECIMVRVTMAEHKELLAAARQLGVSLSALLMRPWRKGK
jgi:predicted HicB family RNase H-like nuclease